MDDKKIILWTGNSHATGKSYYHNFIPTDEYLHNELFVNMIEKIRVDDTVFNKIYNSTKAKDEITNSLNNNVKTKIDIH